MPFLITLKLSFIQIAFATYKKTNMITKSPITFNILIMVFLIFLSFYLSVTNNERQKNTDESFSFKAP